MGTKYQKNSYPDADSKRAYEEGVEYQDFIVGYFAREHGIFVVTYSSKYYQYRYGESYNGFEIKLDKRSEDTGNLSIEVMEKTRADKNNWSESGILRKDNTVFYVQGNLGFFYVFHKRFLVVLYNREYVNKVWQPKKTIKTFLMPLSDADKYCYKKFTVKETPEAQDLRAWWRENQ